MPVMPSFTGFAPKPDIAGVMQRREQLQQQAAQAAMTFQNQRAQLAQARELAEMESGIKERSLQQNAFESMQRLAVDREYKKGLVSIQERKLSEQAAKAARTYDAQMGLSNEVKMIEDGNDPPEVKQQKIVSAYLRWGPKGGTFPGAGGIISASRPRQTSKLSLEEFKQRLDLQRESQKQNTLDIKAASNRSSLLLQKREEMVKERQQRIEDRTLIKDKKLALKNLDAIDDLDRKLAQIEKELQGTPSVPQPPAAPTAPSATGPKRFRFNIQTGKFE